MSEPDGPPVGGRTQSQQAELDRLTAENEKLSSALGRRVAVRTFMAGALVVVTSLLFVASTVAVWGNRTVFDTDNFMSVVEPAIDDPALAESLSRNISDQVIEALDLETRVRARLTQLDEFLTEELVDALDVSDAAQTALSLVDRASLADLTPSIVDPLEERVRARITGFLTSEDFQQRLPLLIRRAHEASLALINDDLSDFPNVYATEDEVRINLIPIVVEALEPLIDTLSGYVPDITLPDVVSDRLPEARGDLASALGVELPDDFGQLTIMSTESLASVQDGAKTVNRATWLTVALTVMFLIVTLVVAPNRRRTLVWLSIGITVALALGWWTVAQIRESVLDEIVQPDSREAIRSMLQQVRVSFRTYVLVVLVLAIVAGLAAFLSAHVDSLTRSGRWVQQQTNEPTPLNAWVSAHYDGLRVTGFVVAAVLLLLSGIGVASFLVIGAVLAIYLLALGAVRRDEPRTPAPSEV